MLFNFLSVFYYFFLVADTVESISISCWLVECGEGFIICHVPQRWLNTIIKGCVKSVYSLYHWQLQIKKYTFWTFFFCVIKMKREEKGSIFLLVSSFALKVFSKCIKLRFNLNKGRAAVTFHRTFKCFLKTPCMRHVFRAVDWVLWIL